MSSNITMKYNSFFNICTIPQFSEIKQTAGALPRKNNGVLVEEKAKEPHRKRGVKRLASNCDLCAAKRLKTMVT